MNGTVASGFLPTLSLPVPLCIFLMETGNNTLPLMASYPRWIVTDSVLSSLQMSCSCLKFSSLRDHGPLLSLTSPCQCLLPPPPTFLPDSSLPPLPRPLSISSSDFILSASLCVTVCLFTSPSCSQGQLLMTSSSWTWNIPITSGGRGTQIPGSKKPVLSREQDLISKSKQNNNK